MIQNFSGPAGTHREVGDYWMPAFAGMTAALAATYSSMRSGVVP
jgi:hypothetical protein